MGATGRNKGEWKPQQRLCEEPTVPQSLCSLHLDPFCASAAQLRTGNYKMNARTQGERCLLGKSTCDGVLLWLLTEIELKLRGDVTLKDRSSIHAHCISTSAHQGFLPFCELKPHDSITAHVLFSLVWARFQLISFIHRKGHASLLEEPLLFRAIKAAF